MNVSFPVLTLEGSRVTRSEAQPLGPHNTCSAIKGTETQAEEALHPTPVLLPGESHGRRSLVGCSPWRREESGTTERLHFHLPLSCTGEGNGTPLQCSCLENPRDREPGGLQSVGLHRVGYD